MVKFKTFLLEAAGKGLTMFDVDETMFMTKAKVHVVKDGKVIKKSENLNYLITKTSWSNLKLIK